MVKEVLWACLEQGLSTTGYGAKTGRVWETALDGPVPWSCQDGNVTAAPASKKGVRREQRKTRKRDSFKYPLKWATDSAVNVPWRNTLVSTLQAWFNQNIHDEMVFWFIWEY